MNKVVLTGRLTRDPEVRYSQGERQVNVARYTLAVERRHQEGQQAADFIQCVAYDKAADFAEKYLRQGTKILVLGHIQTGSFTNRDGVKVYTTDVIVENHEFCESKSAGASGNNSGAALPQMEPNNAQPVQQAAAPQPTPAAQTLQPTYQQMPSQSVPQQQNYQQAASQPGYQGFQQMPVQNAPQQGQQQIPGFMSIPDGAGTEVPFN